MRLIAKAALALGAGSLGAALTASICAAWDRASPTPSDSGPSPAPLEPTRRTRLGVVLNPVKNNAGATRAALEQAARTAGWDRPLFYETTPEDTGRAQAEQALSDGCRIIVAAGGDGTVRAVATALAGTDAIMGVVPLGTGNLLARNLEMPYNDLAACVDSALHGSPRAIDMVGVEVELEDGGSRTDSFLVMGGAGFDAQIMTDAREDLKSRWGWLAYVEAGARNLVAVRYAVRVTVDEARPLVRRTRSVLLANCGELQAGIRLSSATLDDGRMETVLLTPRNLLGWAAVVVQVITGRHGLVRVIERIGGETVHVDFMNHAQPMELDGDYIGKVSAVRASVRKNALSVNAHPGSVRSSRAAAALRGEIFRTRLRRGRP